MMINEEALMIMFYYIRVVLVHVRVVRPYPLKLIQILKQPGKVVFTAGQFARWLALNETPGRVMAYLDCSLSN